MKKKYTKKQITEAIAYWNQKLALEEAFEELNVAILKESKINEADAKIIADVKDKIEDEVKKPEDVQKFILKNDSKVKAVNNSLLSKAWDLLKKIVKLGAKGFKWIIDNWKYVLIALIAVGLAIAFFNPGGAAKWTLKLAVKPLEYVVEKFADGLAWLTGPEYMAAGEKISNANIEAGGFGGWSGAGLGGGLR